MVSRRPQRTRYDRQPSFNSSWGSVSLLSIRVSVLVVGLAILRMSITLLLPLLKKCNTLLATLYFVSKSQFQGPKKVSPLFVPRLLINLAAGHISMRHGFRVRFPPSSLYISAYSFHIGSKPRCEHRLYHRSTFYW